MGAKPNLMVIHRKMNHAPAELKQALARVPVLFVLPDGIVHGLFGEAVL